MERSDTLFGHDESLMVFETESAEVDGREVLVAVGYECDDAGQEG
jgi:hypothetical protein